MKYLKHLILKFLFRFSAGLNCLGLIDEMKICPQGFKKLFMYEDSPLTATQLLNVFDDIQLSEDGSNTRLRENDILCYWRDYIYDKEGKGLVNPKR